MTVADIELDMPGSLVAVGTQEFASTFLNELIRNVSAHPLLDYAAEAEMSGDESLDCSIDKVVRLGDRVIVTVAFDFDEARPDSAAGTFDVVLDMDERRAYVADEPANF